MARSYTPSQTTLMGAGYSQDQSQFSAYSILGPSQFPESVAFWHNPSPTQPQQPQQQQQQHQQPTVTATDLSTPATPYLPSTQNQQRSSQPATDQKKHKRTRSGCFTCRSRRIKCDEGRPVCDRCRKGSRDCVYPPHPTASTSKAGARSRSKSKGPGPRTQGSDSPNQGDNDDTRALDTIADDEEDEEHSVESGSRARIRSSPSKRHGSTQSLSAGGRQPAELSSSSPSTEASSRLDSMSTRSGSVGLYPQEQGTSHLTEDLRFYLIFHQEVLTFRHYLLRNWCDRFVHQTITELALQYEPLLYAVVGFAAYHYCVQSGNGKLFTFLKYYNKAMTLLRESLSSGEKHTEATLATVLVLTTFEEFSGDWVSLISHHHAAHALMHELLTPESINTNDLHSHIFQWYARFDVVAGMLAGSEAILSRDWYMAKEEHDAQLAALYPHDTQQQINLAGSINRRFGLDMASLYAKLSSGMISIDEFVAQNGILGQTLERMKDILVAVDDPEHIVQAYPNQQPLTDNDPFDPYVPGVLHQGPLWRLNFAWIDYLSTKTMYLYQSFRALQQPPMFELENLALEQCRLVEAITRWPEKENGYFLSFANCLGISSLLLPRDEKHIMWCRRKFIQMEQNGYVTAPRFRAGMAALWQMPELTHWWLPNNEGYPEIVREVRALTDERTKNPQDGFRESVRDMKTLFGNFNLDDTESDKSPPSVLGGGL